MHYREIKPEGFIRNFVKCFWEYDGGGQAVTHTILPDGYFDLIAVFEDQQLKNIMLTGVWTKPVTVTIAGNEKLFSIRFKLPAAEYLFKHTIKSILDTTAFLPLDFWGIDSLDFSDPGEAAGKLFHRITLALPHLKEIDNRKLRLFELAYEGRVQTVKELSALVFWSSRQMNRYFGQQYGFPLKTFLNIVRCNASYAHIAKGELYPAGYFDQAHFIREIRKYTNTTPGKLSANKNGRFIQLTTLSRK